MYNSSTVQCHCNSLQFVNSVLIGWDFFLWQKHIKKTENKRHYNLNAGLLKLNYNNLVWLVRQVFFMLNAQHIIIYNCMHKWIPYIYIQVLKSSGFFLLRNQFCKTFNKVVIIQYNVSIKNNKAKQYLILMACFILLYVHDLYIIPL